MQTVGDRILQRAVTGSIAIHVIAFLLLVFGLHRQLAKPDQQPETFEDEIVLNLASLPEFTIEPEPEPELVPEPEPEPDEPAPLDPEDPQRQFLVADHVQDSGAAPEDARFESDRDTLASSRLGPDRNAAADAPSLTGESPRDTLSTVDTDFLDGEEITPPVTPTEPLVALEPPAPEPTPPIEPQPEPLPEPQPLDPLVAAADLTNLLFDPLADHQLVVREDATETESDLPPSEPEEMPVDQPEEIEPRDELPPESEPLENPTEPADANEKPGGPIMLEPFEIVTPRSSEQRTSEQPGGADRGDVDSFLAMRTAEGEYKRQLYGLIERRWRRLTNENLAMKTYSQVKVAVVINRDGSIVSARITESAANPAMREAALRAVQEADLPPVPAAIPAPYYYAMEFLVY